MVPPRMLTTTATHPVPRRWKATAMLTTVLTLTLSLIQQRRNRRRWSALASSRNERLCVCACVCVRARECVPRCRHGRGRGRGRGHRCGGASLCFVCLPRTICQTRVYTNPRRCGFPVQANMLRNDAFMAKLGFGGGGGHHKSRKKATPGGWVWVWVGMWVYTRRLCHSKAVICTNTRTHEHTRPHAPTQRMRLL